jgi:hypothetical protein
MASCGPFNGQSRAGIERLGLRGARPMRCFPTLAGEANVNRDRLGARAVIDNGTPRQMQRTLHRRTRGSSHRSLQLFPACRVLSLNGHKCKHP